MCSSSSACSRSYASCDSQVVPWSPSVVGTEDLLTGTLGQTTKVPVSRITAGMENAGCSAGAARAAGRDLHGDRPGARREAVGDQRRLALRHVDLGQADLLAAGRAGPDPAGRLLAGVL